MNNVILIGMPGCGKSTVAHVAEQIHGYNVFDTDAIIVSMYGEISKIFDDFGERYFRDIENEVLKNLNGLESNSFISVGGGCVLRQENVTIMKSNGNKVVYLRTKISTLEERLQNDNTRPLLQGNTAERLQKLFSERSKIYESVADVIVDTDGLSPKEIFEKIDFSLNEIRGNK